MSDNIHNHTTGWILYTRIIITMMCDIETSCTNDNSPVSSLQMLAEESHHWVLVLVQMTQILAERINIMLS